MKKGKLYLVPVPLNDNSIQDISPAIRDTVNEIRVFIVEEIRTARRFLRKINPTFPIDDCLFIEMDKHQQYQTSEIWLQSIEKGLDIALMSEAGCPAVADPGWQVVAHAHLQNIQVIPMAGPNAMIMALMASGFNGQRFTFQGYLPVDNAPRKKIIQDMERNAAKGYPQIFMETPYRNQSLFQTLMESLSGNTMLSISASLTTNRQKSITKSVAEWKKSPPDLHKQAAVFVIGTPEKS